MHKELSKNRIRAYIYYSEAVFLYMSIPAVRQYCRKIITLMDGLFYNFSIYERVGEKFLPVLKKYAG